MVTIMLLVLVLLFTIPADAAFKVYLKNGSVLSGVSSYEKKGGEVIIYYGGGSIGVPEREVLKIEETEAPEKDFRGPEAPPVEEAIPSPPPAEETGNKAARTDALRAELDSVNSEIQAVEAEEARIVQAINNRKGVRLTYNTLQLRQLESDLAPLQQELSNIQMKKGALYQRRATLESELQSLQ